MRVRWTRTGAAILVTAVAAGVATLILRPRSGLVEPVPIDVGSYFTVAQLERAEDFRGPQRLLGLAGLVLSGAALTALALRPPARLLGALGRRPVLGGAAAASGISVLLVAVDLPLSAVMHERAFDVGLSSQTWGPWLGDLAKSAGIGVVFTAVGGAVAVALMRRFPRHWWAPASAFVTGFAVISIWLFPVVIDPLFNKFEPLEPGTLRDQVLTLAEEAEVSVGEVYLVDASRRTTAANAYVGGLGKTKRVVLYDNLVKAFPQDQVKMVVAHELAHQKHRDLLRGLAWLALVAPAGTFLVQRLTELFGRPAGPAALPGLALALTLVSFGVGAASNVLSRQVEARADAFSLDLTEDPAAHIAFERRLAVRNISDPDPPSLLHGLFGTHPTTAERIGIGAAWARER